MALQKQIILSNGVTVDYHKILNANVIYTNATVTGADVTSGSYIANTTVASYTTKDWREMHPRAFVEQVPFSLPVSSSQIDSIGRQYLYELLKETAIFSGSIDI